MTNDSTLDEVSKKENRVSSGPPPFVSSLHLGNPLSGQAGHNCAPYSGVLPFMKAVITDNTRRTGYDRSQAPFFTSVFTCVKYQAILIPDNTAFERKTNYCLVYREAIPLNEETRFLREYKYGNNVKSLLQLFIQSPLSDFQKKLLQSNYRVIWNTSNTFHFI